MGACPRKSSPPNLTCDLNFENWARNLGYLRIAGVDEVGRGALFGPVCAAAAVLDHQNLPAGIDDSKKLSPKQREVLAEKIRETALDYSIVFVDVAVIDEINILRATEEAIQNAVIALREPPDFLLCDGIMVPGCHMPQRSIIKGDAQSVSIGAASILAKVARDQLIRTLARQYPGYDLESNMGYGTVKHRQALRSLGPTLLHRRTFRGVADCVERSPKDTSNIRSSRDIETKERKWL